MKKDLLFLYGEYLQLRDTSKEYLLEKMYDAKMQAIDIILKDMPYGAKNPALEIKVDINKVLNKIEKIKEEYPEPNCYMLASIVTQEFGGTVLYNSDHCVVSLGNFYFDKSGIVDPDKITYPQWLPLEDYGWGIEKGLINSMLEKHGR